MPVWSLQRYRFEGKRKGVPAEILDASIQAIQNIRDVDPRLPPILTLRHLSVATDTPYISLRQIVSRNVNLYKSFYLKKKIPGRTRHREINIPFPILLKVQHWISKNILTCTNPNESSFAFHPGSDPVFAAECHCGCRWILKIDIKDFFHSINERHVYAIFKSLGYNALVSFEMTRITTMLHNIYSPTFPQSKKEWCAIPSYRCDKIGVLPQGAPTSPILSNLALSNTDSKLLEIANNYGFIYTRYADDLVFSTKEKISIKEVKQLKRYVFKTLFSFGFKPNHQKTAIRGPGSRRIVLGLLVDSSRPRLTKEYKNNIRQHLYYLNSPNHGPAKHAVERKTTISNLYHHLYGKIKWAKKIDTKFGDDCYIQFNKINWPPLDIRRQ